jgi:thymidylate synthase
MTLRWKNTTACCAKCSNTEATVRTARAPGAYSVFGEQSRYDLSTTFPLVTTKKLHLRSIIHELLWFFKGDTNVGYLRENKVTIWDEWADENGDLGPVYGAQWRRWQGAPGAEPVDQIAKLIHGLKTNPYSRRHIVSAWNVPHIEKWRCRPATACFSSSSIAAN